MLATTEYQIRKVQSAGIVDYTELRLTSLIAHVKEHPPNKMIYARLQRVRNEYLRGEIAVAWKKGLPIWVYITQEPLLDRLAANEC